MLITKIPSQQTNNIRIHLQNNTSSKINQIKINRSLSLKENSSKLKIIKNDSCHFETQTINQNKPLSIISIFNQLKNA